MKKSEELNFHNIYNWIRAEEHRIFELDSKLRDRHWATKSLRHEWRSECNLSLSDCTREWSMSEMLSYLEHLRARVRSYRGEVLGADLNIV